jgi:lipoate-protein ligase B
MYITRLRRFALESLPVDTPAQLEIEWRGRERYAQTWERQLAVHRARRDGAVPDTLILVEHDPVITLGKHGDPANLLLQPEMLKARGVDLHNVERGGDITYHGPGQLVGYPIIALRERGLSVRDLMRGLEEALIRSAAEYGVETGRIEGLTGVWHSAGKLAALGVAVQGGVSFHGFAFNVDPDLSHFQMIVPCGIVGKPVTSLSAILGRPMSIDELRPVCERHIREVFGYGA